MYKRFTIEDLMAIANYEWNIKFDGMTIGQVKALIMLSNNLKEAMEKSEVRELPILNSDDDIY